MTYIRPVIPVNDRMSSWLAHTERIPPSSEAGTDYYTPIGTPIHAAGNGTVFEVAGDINAKTGRFVTIDLDDGRRCRYLHLSAWQASKGQRVSQADVVGLSGASGYGSEFFGAPTEAQIPANTGGPHVHTTLWPTHAYKFGTTPGTTIDFELYVTPIEMEIDMNVIEVWTCPAWEAANQRVVTNGQACQTYPAGWGQMLVDNGAKYIEFKNNSDMQTAVSIVWELGGLSADQITAKFNELASKAGATV